MGILLILFLREQVRGFKCASLAIGPHADRKRRALSGLTSAAVVSAALLYPSLHDGGPRPAGMMHSMQGCGLDFFVPLTIVSGYRPTLGRRVLQC